MSKRLLSKRTGRKDPKVALQMFNSQNVHPQLSMESTRMRKSKLMESTAYEKKVYR